MQRNLKSPYSLHRCAVDEAEFVGRWLCPPDVNSQPLGLPNAWSKIIVLVPLNQIFDRPHFEVMKIYRSLIFRISPHFSLVTDPSY